MSTKKSLGQHFLTSKTIVYDIVRAADLSSRDTVLEIGPGKGMLTKALLQKAGCVIAVEKDEKLIHKLKLKFKHEVTQKKLILVPADILTLPFEKHVPKDFIVVANIPYYITGQLLRKLLSGKQQPKRVVLMLQHEVARRIAARDGKESLLSISVQAYGTPRYISKVHKRYFKPKPKVDSAIILIENISRTFFKNLDEEMFFTLVKSGFSHKRKLLIKNIEHLFDAQDIRALFEQCDIPQKARAEDLSLAEWRCICNIKNR